MPLDDSFHLRQMREEALVSISFSRGRIRSDLDNDLMFLYALEKAVEIIGEAAAHVSPSIQSGHPEINWEDITGMRHWLVHAYYDINRDVLWETVRDDVPVLIDQLGVLLEQTTC